MYRELASFFDPRANVGSAMRAPRRDPRTKETVMETKASKVWLITGASSGFGRALAEEALSRSDRVVVTARDTKALADLVAKDAERVHAIALDVTKVAQIGPAVASAIARWC